MSGVNKVILIGHLGQDPEVRFTPSGAAVANFSVATNESWTDKSGTKQEKTEWHKIVVWGKTAEICQKYLKKGKQIYIEGKLQTRQWENKEGKTQYTTEINAQHVQFLGSAGGAGASAGAAATAGAAPAADAGFGDDSIPF
jgi:single-strand DNA-binding protein